MRNKFTIIEPPPEGYSIPSQFGKSDFEATIRDKGYNVLFERAILCPCKDDITAEALTTCRNCGGSRYIFGTPLLTTMLFTSITSEQKMTDAALNRWSSLETGSMNITAMSRDKFTYMDRITILDATSIHCQVLYIKQSDDNSSFFAFTIYNIISIEYIAAFVDLNTPLRRLVLGVDYTFEYNVITFINPGAIKSVTIRYRHNPVYHIMHMLRDAMTSTNGKSPSLTKIELPVYGIGSRAHIIDDAENLTNTRVLENRTN